MPAPRIDVVRRQLAGTAETLALAGRILETLHELAYDRPAAVERIRVRGGQPDYALDRNGDPAARAAYMRLARMIDHVCCHISDNAHGALALVNEADDDAGRRHPVTITALEHAELLAAQARRAARGEFNPGRSTLQPAVPGAKKTLEKKIRAVEAELVAERRKVARLEARLARFEERAR